MNAEDIKNDENILNYLREKYPGKKMGVLRWESFKEYFSLLSSLLSPEGSQRMKGLFYFDPSTNDYYFSEEHFRFKKNNHLIKSMAKLDKQYFFRLFLDNVLLLDIIS